MKHFFRFQLFTLILLLSCAFQTELKAQIDATKTPDWVQRLKKIPLQQADTAALDSIRNTIQGKEFNPETGKWEWRQFPYGLVKADISNHSLKQLSEDTMKLYSLSDGLDGSIRVDSFGNLYKDTTLIHRARKPSFMTSNTDSTGKILNIDGLGGWLEGGDTTHWWRTWGEPYRWNYWSDEFNLAQSWKYGIPQGRYKNTLTSVWNGNFWMIHRGYGQSNIIMQSFTYDSTYLTIDRGNTIQSTRGKQYLAEKGQKPKYADLPPETGVMMFRAFGTMPRAEDSTKIYTRELVRVTLSSGVDTLVKDVNHNGQIRMQVVPNQSTTLEDAFLIKDNNDLKWQGWAYQNTPTGIAYFDSLGILQKSETDFEDFIKPSDFSDGNEGYFKVKADGSFEKVTPTEAFLGLAKNLPQYQNDSAAQAIGDLTAYEDFYINAETGAITKILTSLAVCDFGTPTAFDKSSQADPIRFFQLYYNNGGVFPSTVPQVGDSVTTTIDGTAHVMTVQSITPGLSITLSCPDGLHTQFGNGYYNNLISNMASFTIECN